MFTDDTKALTLFMLNRRHGFEIDERRVRIGDAWADLPLVHLEVDGVPVTLTVYSRDDERHVPRQRGDAEGPVRARLAEVEALLVA